VPTGIWTATVDLPTELEVRALHPGETPDHAAAVTIIRLETVQDGGCGYGGSIPWLAGQRDPASFMTWLQGQLPGNLGSPRAVTIAGRAGLQAELRPSTELRQTCDFGFLLTDVDGDGGRAPIELPVDGRRVRIAAIAMSGQLVVILETNDWTAQFGDLSAEEDALVASLQSR